MHGALQSPVQGEPKGHAELWVKRRALCFAALFVGVLISGAMACARGHEEVPGPRLPSDVGAWLGPCEDHLQIALPQSYALHLAPSHGAPRVGRVLSGARVQLCRRRQHWLGILTPFKDARGEDLELWLSLRQSEHLSEKMEFAMRGELWSNTALGPQFHRRELDDYVPFAQVERGLVRAQTVAGGSSPGWLRVAQYRGGIELGGWAPSASVGRCSAGACVRADETELPQGWKASRGDESALGRQLASRFAHARAWYRVEASVQGQSCQAWLVDAPTDAARGVLRRSGPGRFRGISYPNAILRTQAFELSGASLMLLGPSSEPSPEFLARIAAIQASQTPASPGQRRPRVQPGSSRVRGVQQLLLVEYDADTLRFVEVPDTPNGDTLAPLRSGPIFAYSPRFSVTWYASLEGCEAALGRSTS